MGNVKDYDLLLPEDDRVAFTAHSDRKRYEIELFIPAAVGLYIINNVNEIAALLPSAGKAPELTPERLDIILKVFEMICCQQHEHMTKDWISENISLPRLVAILVDLMKPIYEFFTNQGLLEAAQPEKEPMTE